MTDFSVLRQRMVDNQIRTSEVTDRDVIDAFLSVPREAFVGAGREAVCLCRPRAADGGGGSPTPHDGPGPAGAACARAAARRRRSRRWWLAAAAAIRRRSSRGLSARSWRSRRTRLSPRWRARTSRRVGAANVSVVEAKLTDGHPAGGPYRRHPDRRRGRNRSRGASAQLEPGGALATIERDGGVSRAMLYERSARTPEMAALRRLGHACFRALSAAASLFSE